jgi:hypothetical protein
MVAMPIEPVKSILMPSSRNEARQGIRSGRILQAELRSHRDLAMQDTIVRFEAVGSKVVKDTRQAKESFANHLIHGLADITADGFRFQLRIAVTGCAPSQHRLQTP